MNEERLSGGLATRRAAEKLRIMSRCHDILLERSARHLTFTALDVREEICRLPETEFKTLKAAAGEQKEEPVRSGRIGKEITAGGRESNPHTHNKTYIFNCIAFCNISS